MTASQSVYLHIELLDDVVVSASAASAGGHASLHYIPGAILRGAVAEQLYGRPGIDGFTMFHSDAVRFGDGWPILADKDQAGLDGVGQVGLPIPLALHYPKKNERDWDRGGELDRELIVNLSRGNQKTDEQHKQLRSSFIASDSTKKSLNVFEPAMNFVMKTAISPTTGRSAEAQLFGYEALAAGSCFLARIEADDPDLCRQVRDCLIGKTIRIGRSKGVEYGRVRVRMPDDLKIDWQQAIDTKGKQVVFWALSDIALVDEAGVATLRPEHRMFDLDESFKLEADRTFIRTRRYLPFNAHWGSPDLERVVIAAGSVITFCREEIDHKVPLPLGHCWVGQGRATGLGQVWANPPLLASVEPGCWEGFTCKLPSAIPCNSPDDLLIGWLRRRQSAQSAAEQMRARMSEILDDLSRRYAAAAAMQGLPASEMIGPGVSQWQQVAAVMRGAKTKQQLVKTLFGDQGLAREDDQKWRIECRDGNDRSFHHWLKQQIDEPPDAEAAFDSQAAGLHWLATEIAEQLKVMR